MIGHHIAHQRNKLINRSGSRSCDICLENEILVEHHIMGRKIPHPNRASNIANVCCNCHMNIHSGIIIIERWLKGTSGSVLAWHKKGKDGVTGEDSIPYQIGQK